MKKTTLLSAIILTIHAAIAQTKLYVVEISGTAICRNKELVRKDTVHSNDTIVLQTHGTSLILFDPVTNLRYVIPGVNDAKTTVDIFRKFVSDYYNGAEPKYFTGTKGPENDSANVLALRAYLKYHFGDQDTISVQLLDLEQTLYMNLPESLIGPEYQYYLKNEYDLIPIQIKNKKLEFARKMADVANNGKELISESYWKLYVQNDKMNFQTLLLIIRFENLDLIPVK